ncbi:glycosyltransferase family 9 protein [Bailinhaonella thermotolerans]|uniref:glycosyltransferase family 9 protein n=1 Tax=Bailinhaonella thermotolerans TaxID=1070861 RepID=UPI001F5B0C3A|nr:glycosyltransferase family 9 protein [Bailinhaonella thermotolerans]
MSRVLVLRALGVGDLLTAVPALRAIRRGRPGDHITLAAPAWLADLVPLIGAVDELLPAGELEPIRARGEDLAVNMHGCGPRSHCLLKATGPGRLWAYANPVAGFADGPRWREDEHEVARWCRLVEWYGLRPDPRDLSLAVPDAPSPAPGAIVVHPGGKSPARRWPAGRFAEVARALAADGHEIVVTGNAAEESLAEAVGCRSLAGRTSLAELCALIAGARLVITGDTGAAHLATAYGTPSVIVFGPIPPTRWGPPPGPRHTVLWPGTTSDPDADRPGPELLATTPAMVLAAARAHLRVPAR